MKEEIKEILEKLKENISIVSVEEEHLLLDYITNLQEENERLKEVLKNNGVVKTCENCEWFGVCPHSYREYDYKQRNEKVIPMLKELNIKIKEILKISIDIKEISDIENILKGDKDE